MVRMAAVTIFICGGVTSEVSAALDIMMKYGPSRSPSPLAAGRRVTAYPPFSCLRLACFAVRSRKRSNCASPCGRLRQRPIGFPVKTQQQLNNPTRVVNLGLKTFASDFKEKGVQGVHVPAGAEFKLANLLSKLGN